MSNCRIFPVSSLCPSPLTDLSQGTNEFRHYSNECLLYLALVGGKYIGYAQYKSFPFDREYFSSSVASTVVSPGVAAGPSSLFPEESTSLTRSQKAEKENEQLIIDISREDDVPLSYHPAHPHPHHVAAVSSTAPSSADNSPAPSAQDLLAGQPAPVQSQQTGEEGGGTRDSSSSSLDFPLISLQTSGY